VHSVKAFVAVASYARADRQAQPVAGRGTRHDRLHLAIASIPMLAISADVFGWISLRTVAIGLLLPLDLLAPAGRQLFPLTPVTVSLSLAGHLIYGVILGQGYWMSRRLEEHWPIGLARVSVLPR
jgi:hypothetical protein